MKGYWLILGGEVTDAAAQAEYGRLWAPVAAKYGAKVLRGAEAPSLTEARAGTTRVLLVEFPGIDAARQCYADPDYAQAAIWAAKASTRDLLILEGDLPGAIPAR